MFEIETGVPIPPRTTLVKGMSKYPFASMNVGDSFFVPVGENGKIRTPNHPKSIKVATRKVDGGLRIWRVE